MTISLAKLVVPTLEGTFEFPGFPGFNVNLCFISREELVKLRKKASRTKIDKKTRQTVDEVDEELFLQVYVESVVKGWEGLSLETLAQLMPMDLSSVKDKTELVEHTAENALVLMKNSPDFDRFVTDNISDLQTFTTASSK